MRIPAIARKAVVAAVLALLAAFAILQTRVAKDLVASTIAGAIGEPGLRSAVVEGVSGVLPFSVRVERFELGDHEGTWLELRGLSWRLSVARLLAGRLRFESLAAAEVWLTRLPRRPSDAPQGEDPVSMPMLEIADLHVDRLFIGAELLGVRGPDAGARAWIGPLDTRAAGKVGGAGPAIDARLAAVGPIRAPVGELDCAAADLDLVIGGRFPLARIEAGLECVGLSGPGLEAERFELEAEAAPSPKQGERAYRIELRGGLIAARLAPPLDALVGEAGKLQAELLVGVPDAAVVIEGLRARGAGVELVGEGRVTRDGRVELRPLTVVRLDLSRLGAQGLEGVVAGSAELSAGGESRVAVSASVDVAGVVVAGRALTDLVGAGPELVLDVSLGRDGRVEADPVALVGAALSLTAHGTMMPSTGAVDVVVEARSDDLGAAPAFAEAVSVGTDVALEARIGGELSRLTVEIGIDSRLGEAQARGRAVIEARERLEIQQFEARISGTRLEAQGSVDLTAGLATGTIDVAIEDLSLHPAARTAGLEGAGDLHVRAVATSGRQDVGLSLDAVGPALRVAGARTRARTVSVSADLTDIFGAVSGWTRVHIEGLDAVDAALLELDELTVSAKAAAGVWSIDAAAAGRGREPLELAMTASVVPPRENGDALRIDLTGLGGTLLGRTLAMESTARLTYADGGPDAASSVTVEGLSISLGDARIHGGLFATEETLRGRIDVTRLPLELLRFLPRAPSLSGSLDGRIDAEAGALHGRATLTGLRPLGREAGGAGEAGEADLAGRLGFDWSAAGFDASANLVGGSGTAVKIAAHLPVAAPGSTAAAGQVVAADGELRISVVGDIEAGDLDRLLGLTDGAVAGSLSLDLELVGSADRPRVQGRATLERGRYESRISGAVLEDVIVRVVAAGGTRIQLALEATDGVDGSFAVSAVADLGAGLDAISYSADVRARGARVVQLDEARVRVDADLVFEGGPQAARLGGQVKVLDADLRLAARSSPDVTKLEVVEINTSYARGRHSTGDGKHPARPVDLDVAVSADGQVFVRSPELESEWRGSLRIGATSAAPELVGRLSIVRGHFGTAGVRFVLREGRITFDPGPQLDPAVRVVGEATRDDVVARLVISGTSSNPTIDLTSEPSMPPDEIFSRLLFGESASALSAGQSLQLAAALSRLLRGGGGADPVGWLRRTFGVDHISFSGSDEQGVGGTVVTIGKYVAPGVFVSVDRGLTNDSSRARVEVSVTRSLSVESEVGADSTGSLGVNWRWRY